MNYSFFLFSKLYELTFPEDSGLEYDLLFDKLVLLYREYYGSVYNNEFQSEYTCITDYFSNRQIKLQNEQRD